MNTEEVSVELQFTPNPDTLKYVVNQKLLAAGASNFTSRDAAKNRSPLAEALFEDALISAVMIGTDFVTITVQDQSSLQTLNDRTIQTIRTFLLKGVPAVSDSPKINTAKLSQIEQKIVEILDRDVRPAVAMDGGDISFEKFEDGFVYLKMQGSCSGCPSSLMTLKMGVETRLKDAIPEVIEVIPV